MSGTVSQWWPGFPAIAVPTWWNTAGGALAPLAPANELVSSSPPVVLMEPYNVRAPGSTTVPSQIWPPQPQAPPVP